MIFLKIFFSIALFSLISACSSGGGSTPPKAADISADNAQKLSIAATESARQAVNTDTAGEFNPFLSKSAPSSFNVEAFSEKLATQVQSATNLGPLCSSGIYSLDFNDNTGKGSITFTNCALIESEGTVVFSGIMTITITETSLTFSYTDFTITYNGITETINFTLSCTESSCTSSSSINGIDGRKYTVSDISVTNNFDSSYDISAEVVDPEFGIISIDAQSIAFECTGILIDRPSSGTITFSSNGKSASVVFTNCNSYTVTVDGVADNYVWFEDIGIAKQ